MSTRSGTVPTPESRRPRSSGSERGTSAIEFVVIAPAFLLLIAVIVEAGLYFHARDTAESSAREGVSALRLGGTNSDPGSFRAYAEQIATNFATEIGDLRNVTTAASIDQASGQVEVTVTGDVVLPVGGTFTVHQTASATLEQWIPDLRQAS